MIITTDVADRIAGALVLDALERHVSVDQLRAIVEDFEREADKLGAADGLDDHLEDLTRGYRHGASFVRDIIAARVRREQRGLELRHVLSAWAGQASPDNGAHRSCRPWIGDVDQRRCSLFTSPELSVLEMAIGWAVEKTADPYLASLLAEVRQELRLRGIEPLRPPPRAAEE